MIGKGLVQCWAADLDHLKSLRGFEHTVTDLGWLQDAISGVKHEGRSLVLVDHLYPSRLAEDHLEPHPVIVDVIRYWAAFWNADMRGDKTPSQAAGDEVTILHACPTGCPR